MKMKLKTQIAAVWAVALMLLGSLTVHAAYTTINVDLVRQAKSNWCWAACIEMSAHYLGYTTYDQWDIVKEVKGTASNPYPNYSSGDENAFSEGMEFATDNDYTITFTAGTISIDSMNTYMENHMPLIIGLGKYEGNKRKSGHAVVVYSVDKVNNYFKARNPASDYDSQYNYSIITNTSEATHWDGTFEIS